jgi:hypothetical protein
MDNGWIRAEFRTRIDKPLAEVARRFDQNLMQYLAPAFPRLRLHTHEGNHPGSRVSVGLDFLLFEWKWEVEIVSEERRTGSWVFVDEGRRLPPFLSAWRHEHGLFALSTQQTEITDRIFWRPGRYWPSFLVRILVESQFRRRGPLYRRFFESGKA